jgi:hypothetical protein
MELETDSKIRKRLIEKIKKMSRSRLLELDSYTTRDEESTEPYDPEFVAKIKKAEKGEFETLTPEKQKEWFSE